MSKKTLTILFASALLTGFMSCGMSEEERKADSAQQDSVKSETEATTDDLIAQMERENDSIAAADSVKHISDSVAKADSMAKLKK
jgi:hypothetical protein